MKLQYYLFNNFRSLISSNLPIATTYSSSNSFEAPSQSSLQPRLECPPEGNLKLDRHWVNCIQGDYSVKQVFKIGEYHPGRQY